MAFLTIRPNFKNGDKLPQSFKTRKRYGSIDFKRFSKVTNAGLVNDSLSISFKVTGDVEIEREFNIKATQLHKKDFEAPYVFTDSGDGFYSFSCTVIMTNTWDYYNLDYLYRNRVPVNVVIDAYAIPNDMYMIVEASKRTVVRRGVWKVELKLTRYSSTNAVHITNKTVKQKKVDKLTNNTLKCTLKKWTAKDKNKKDVNNCNQLITMILYKKGLLKKKYVGKNWDVSYTKKITSYNTKGKRTVSQTIVKKYYPCRLALKSFQKKWNKKKLKPHLKETGKKDTDTLKALKRYKEI